MNKCPCKECISLAICKSQVTIVCSILRKLFGNMKHGDDEMKEMWNIVHEELPRVVAVMWEAALDD